MGISNCGYLSRERAVGVSPCCNVSEATPELPPKGCAVSRVKGLSAEFIPNSGGTTDYFSS